MSYSSIKKKKCKEIGCEKFPIVGLNGKCFDHADEDLIKKKRKNSILNKKKEHGKVRKLAVKTVIRPVQRNPINKSSKKRMAELKIYVLLKRDFIKDHPTCECGLPDCNKGKSVDIHHPYMGRDRAKYFLEVDTWKAVSRRDHFRIHNEFSSEQLVQLGLRKID